MGAGILDRVVFPTQIKKGNPLSTRLHELAHFQVLKLGSSPNLYKLSHATSFLAPGLFRNSFRRAALDLNSVLASISAPTPRSAFHIPNRRKQATSDISET